MAFLLAIFMNIMQFKWNDEVIKLLTFFGNLVVPLALISVGMQWKLDPHSRHWLLISYGLAYKLILFPLLLIILFVLILGKRGEIIEISILEAAMAPMVTAGIIATSYGLKPRFCAMMLGVGIPVSFFTLGIIYFLLQLLTR